MAAVVVAGTGMVPFRKPGASPPYDELAREAIVAALADAGIDYADVQQAYAGFVYGDSTSGQRALYAVGMTGIPVVNVNNNCSTGSTALFLARQAVEGGAADCVLAVGFEQMRPGAIGTVFGDRPSPFERFDRVCAELAADAGDIPLALRYFGGAGREHMRRYGTKLATFAKIRAKASRHAQHNPNALFRRVVTDEEVLADVPLWPGVMTRLMACPPTCGAAAAVVTSEAYARRRGVRGVRIRAQAMTTDTPSTFDGASMMRLVGCDMTRAAADRVYEDAGVAPEDVGVCELHDCFAHNELVSYEALRLCPDGGAERFVEDGDNSYGGRVVTNPSGGLLSKGHPLGATGLAQCYELAVQLRGAAGARQVEGARLALQHNLGLGGACVVTLYERA
ncbi:MAG: lipid-transfer protein [Betaproteobacteria bacterium]|nr:MAG: lipid-transfer protein [Betaproteobacteria bacterium]